MTDIERKSALMRAGAALMKSREEALEVIRGIDYALEKIMSQLQESNIITS